MCGGGNKIHSLLPKSTPPPPPHLIDSFKGRARRCVPKGRFHSIYLTHTHSLYCPHIRCNLGQAREDSETPDARRESHVLPNLFPDAFFPASSQLSASGIILISSSCSPHRDTYASSSSLLLPPTLWNNRSRGGGGRSRLFCPRFVGRLPPLRRIRADTPD